MSSPVESLTLKEVLSCLADRHGLPEVLDRLVELSDFYAETTESPETAIAWNNLTKTLEAATRQAKQLEFSLQHFQRHPDDL
jgi:hypothetical protein